MSVPTSVNGFSVLATSYSSSSKHYLYARAHIGSKNGKDIWPAGRTLFLVNVPPDATERELTLFFKSSGTVEKVVFDVDGADGLEDDNGDDDSDEEGEDAEEAPAEESQPRKRRKVAKDNEPPKVIPIPQKPHRTLRPSGRSAHVVFLDSSSLERSLVPPTKPRPWPTDPDAPSGLSHYTTLYQSLRPPLDAVRQYADSAMELYEFELAKTKRKSQFRKGEAIVDEDGFTLVTRGGAYGQTLGGGVSVASKKFQRSGVASSRHRSQKKDKEKPGFYAFQKAEKQRNNLIELKKKWEHDKEKIEKLKASRRFKPY